MQRFEFLCPWRAFGSKINQWKNQILDLERLGPQRLERLKGLSRQLKEIIEFAIIGIDVRSRALMQQSDVANTTTPVKSATGSTAIQ